MNWENWNCLFWHRHFGQPQCFAQFQSWCVVLAWEGDVWELREDVWLCICTDRSHPKITPGALKATQSAEAIITLPSGRAQINASPSLSFLKLFLEPWYLGIPHAWLLFPALLPPSASPVLWCPCPRVILVFRTQDSSPGLCLSPETLAAVKKSC